MKSCNRLLDTHSVAPLEGGSPGFPAVVAGTDVVGGTGTEVGGLVVLSAAVVVVVPCTGIVPTAAARSLAPVGTVKLLRKGCGRHQAPLATAGCEGSLTA